MLCWDPYSTAWPKSHSVPQPGQVLQYLEPTEQLGAPSSPSPAQEYREMECLKARG